jgi:hypothetical protein
VPTVYKEKGAYESQNEGQGSYKGQKEGNRTSKKFCDQKVLRAYESLNPALKSCPGYNDEQWHSRNLP